MIKSTFITSINNFKKMCLFIISLPTNIIEGIVWVKKYISDTNSKFKNLSSINIELGIYHLKKGNYNDAILRFQIVSRFLKQQVEESYYWMSITYFIKGNYQKSLRCLEFVTTQDSIGLKSFIQNCKTSSFVPQKIWDMYRNLTLEYYNFRFISKDVDIAKEFVKILLSGVEEFPPNCKILDYGCGDGIFGHNINEMIVKDFRLVGVESSDEMVKSLKLNNVINHKEVIYDEVASLWPQDFVEYHVKEKFNVIVSFASLSYTSDIQKVVEKFSKILIPGGYFCLLLPCNNNNTVFDIKYSWFVFNIDYVKKVLEDVNFQLLTEHKFKILDKSLIYNILLLKNSN